MKTRVGIPRAMGYYYLYPFYKTFIEQLGAEAVVSPPTTQATLDRMEACPTDEPCIAVKLYFAHVEKLLSMGVDFILSPVLVSLEKDNFCCPKFIGISDMIRNGLHIDESKLISPRFNIKMEPNEIIQSLFLYAKKLGVIDRNVVCNAFYKALDAQASVEKMMYEQQLTLEEAYRYIDSEEKQKPPESNRIALNLCAEISTPRIAIIGHPYILYEMISHRIIDKVEEYGRIVTAEMVNKDNIQAAIANIFEGSRMWSFEGKMLGAALHLLKHKLVDKLILIGSFECGPESIIESYIEEEAQNQGIPLLLLTIDEQTGEAGLDTRIEAFMDTAAYKSTNSDEKDSADDHKTYHEYVSPSAHKELLVGIPSMGYLDIAVRTILEDCGTRCIKNPGTTKKAIELGKELAPEFVCFPLTATLGQMRMLLDKGANTIFMLNGKGRCRLGWYAQVQEQLLKRAGYDFEMITLDSPLPIKANWHQFSDTVKKLTGNTSWKNFIQSFRFGYKKIAAIDEAEDICRKKRAVERNRGEIDTLFDGFVRKIDKAANMRTLKKEIHDFREAAYEIEVEDTNPLKVCIVGEIWVVLEHFVNQNIEKILGSQNDIRVEVSNNLSATNWFKCNVFPDPAAMLKEKKIHRAAHKYLTESVGGHGLESIGSTVVAAREGFDGVIHIFPFTCMPEIVAQNILVRACEDLDMPNLTLIVSEQLGEAGVQTRIEAFLDMLEERRSHRQTEKSKRSIKWHTISA